MVIPGVVIDLFYSGVADWSMQSGMTTNLALQAKAQRRLATQAKEQGFDPV
tara:strand:- start:367 stop:519 length:153 start_codon:yes stop_codon:yes gene_type:complete